MQGINEEYFDLQLDSLFEDEDDLKHSIMKQYMFNDTHDIYITQNNTLDEDADIDCVQKLETTRDAIDVYMYLVKVDRTDLPLKSEQ